MKKAIKVRTHYSKQEELVHVITHGIGLMLGIAGLAVLVSFCVLRHGPWEVVSCTIYGATLVLLYLSSTLYHAIRKPPVKQLLQICDHSAIYLLIAGTYTPFMLSTLRGPLGWSLFGIIWSIAIAGIVFKSLFIGRFKTASMVSYLMMGIFILSAVHPLFQALPPISFILLIIGGVCYLLGTTFFGRKHHWLHAVWHLFVLAGSFTHYFSILLGIAL